MTSVGEPAAATTLLPLDSAPGPRLSKDSPRRGMVFIVLHHWDGVALNRAGVLTGEQTAVIALVQTNAKRLIQNVPATPIRPEPIWVASRMPLSFRRHSTYWQRVVSFR